MAIPHPREIQVAVVNWLDERYPFTKAVDEALYQRVPNFANAFYYCFGGMVFILIVFQLLTGVLLALYYVPDATGNPAPAYTIVQFIQNTLYLGLLILARSLTGYLLPWATKAYFDTEVTIKIAGLTPPQQLGMFIKELLQGGPVVGPPTLQRFFTLHVFVLPALIVLLMYVHFRFIRAHGISEPM